MPTHWVDLSRQHFGFLVALEFLGVESGHARWRCRCDCGAETIVWANHLVNGSKRKCSADCRFKPERPQFVRREISARGVATDFSK
jgi:hypothetical protein